jgi:hypothetical protein
VVLHPSPSARIVIAHRVDHDDPSPSAVSWQCAKASMAALGVTPPLPWSHGVRPVPEEDMSAVTVLAGDDGCYGMPFFRGTGVEESTVNPGSGGAVEDVGAPPPSPWSHGARPVPEEDTSTVTVLADGGGLDGPPVRHSLEGQM